MMIIAGGCVLRARTFDCELLDIVIEGDTILDLVPTGRVTRASMSPLPEAVPQEAPAPLAEQVQVKASSARGRSSWTRALVTLLGPAFPTVMV